MRPPRHTAEESLDKASGRWRFLTDHLERPPNGSLFVHIVRSPHAIGRLVSWSPEAALTVPGVHSVWGPSDVPATVFNSAAAPPAPPLEATADQRLLTDHPLHVGDACLAIVVADEATGRRAEQALACIWEAERPVLPDRLSDAPRLGGARSRPTSGSGRSGRPAAEVSEVMVDTENAAVEHLCLEGPACLAEPEVDGTMTVHTNTQAPSDVRRIVARVAGLVLPRVRILKYQEGGGFGAKQEVYDEPLVCYLAARLGRPLWTRRPLRTTLAAGRTRHQTQLRCRATVTGDGDLVEIELRGEVNSGAYSSHLAYVMANIADAGRHLYPEADHRFDLTARFTTQVPGGAFRGYGAAQALLAVEQAVDEAARRTGLSPFEIRRRNARSRDGVGSPSERTGFSRLRDVLDRAEVAWTERRPSPSAPGWARGWGLAACGLLSTTVVPSPEGTVTVLRIDEAGGVTLATGSCDCGTGSSHALAALAGEVLAVEPSRIDVVEGDSTLLLMDLGSFAQRTVYVAGTSVLDAAATLRRRILDAAGARFGCSRDELTLAAGAVVDGTGRVLTDLAELARLEAVNGRPLVAVGGIGGGPGAVPLSYAVVAVTVDVHRGEGSLSVPEALIVADCGTVLDPPRVRGQLEGAFVQGLSATLCERWAPGPAGQGPRTLLEHGALGASRLPDLTVITLDAPEPTGPRGAKGVGELGLPAVAPAVANAVRDAVGRRITRIPIPRVDLATGVGRP